MALRSRSRSARILYCLALLGRGYRRAACLALLVWLGATGGAVAGESSLEFWPEIDLWLRLSPSWRLSMFVPISKNIETDYREGNLVLQADYAWGKTRLLRRDRLLDESRAEQMKAMLVRGGYLSGRSLGDDGEAYTERTILLEWHVRNPLKGGILVSHRLRTDLRWLGDDSEFSTRWRYRVMAEKEVAFGRVSWVPYGNAEAYFDSRYDTVNRIRVIGGTSVAWAPRFALEGNITYQHDARSSVTNLYALNVILHVFFETGRARSPSRRPEMKPGAPDSEMAWMAPDRTRCDQPLGSGIWIGRYNAGMRTSE